LGLGSRVEDVWLRVGVWWGFCLRSSRGVVGVLPEVVAVQSADGHACAKSSRFEFTYIGIHI
jgi:hypothetical protein